LEDPALLADCKHPEEKVLGSHQGQTLASCPTCGQTRRYIEGKEDSTVITKLGRIGDSIVMPPAAVSLDITPSESRLVRQGWDIIHGKSKPTRPAVELLPSVERPESEVLKESPPTYSKPPNWDQLGRKQKTKFYDENKGYILKTIEELGRLPALQKLGIHTATYYALLKRWGLKPQARTKKEKTPRKITGRAELVEAKRVTKEPVPEPAAPFRTGPLNKRHGARAIWRF
jgi:hypothetical protein